MKTIIRTAVAGFFLVSGIAVAQTLTNDADGLYDSTTRVDTNNVSESTSTVTSESENRNYNENTNTTTVESENRNFNESSSTNENTNYNINSGEQTINNNNVNNTTSDNTNRNYNESTSENKNTNINESTSENKNINTNTNTSTSENKNTNTNISTTTSENKNTSTSENKNTNTNTNNNVNQNINSGTMTNNNNNKIDQTIKSPPPSAIAPAMMSGGNSDLCTTGTSGAVQTQILGVSSGGTVRDKNCERLKNAKVLYDMGMKVAAVATLCQDRRVFDAMWNAGTPCPYEGMIGAQAKSAWDANPDKKPAYEEEEGDPFYRKTLFGAMLGYLLFIL